MGKDSELIKTTKEWSEFTKQCKELARQRRAKSPLQVENIPRTLERINDYIQTQRNNNKPLTHGGFMRCFGVSPDTYYKLDDYDYIIDEYRALHDIPDDVEVATDTNGNVFPLVSYSEIKKNICDVAICEQLEENCYNIRAHNSAGSIFGLKARFGWQDDAPQQHLNVGTLNIATSEQALKSLQMLE